VNPINFARHVAKSLFDSVSHSSSTSDVAIVPFRDLMIHVEN
jgi:hypothetical protein